ncbi:hypothetical protein [Methanosarcina sp. WH1]|nr:hypothetical protein [Methanosarcina sp. WH1]
MKEDERRMKEDERRIREEKAVKINKIRHDLNFASWLLFLVFWHESAFK